MKQHSLIDLLEMKQTNEWIWIKSEHRWKTLSSAVLGAGFCYHNQFINRHVPKNYHYSNPADECKRYLQENGFQQSALVMMTSAALEDVAIVRSTKDDPDVLVLVTAGVSNAVNAAEAWSHPDWQASIGTINTWVFIDGMLEEETFVQALITATEAKVRALHDEGVKDKVTKTIATGTSTDSVLIAATQTGPEYEYAGTITSLGKVIGKLVYDGTRAAVKRNKRRMEEKP